MFGFFTSLLSKPTEKGSLEIKGFYFCSVATSEAQMLKNSGKTKPASFVF